MTVATGYRHVLASAVLLGGLAGAAGPLLAAPDYRLVPAQSSVSFVATQQGEKFTGTIRSYDARIRYAPDDLAGSALEATLELKTIDTKSPDRDQALAAADWFDFARYPVATFRTLAIRQTPAGPVGDAELSIKGHTRRIAFPFRWRVSGAGAVLSARVTLDRLDYGLGAGEWADDSIIGHQVEVAVELALVPAATPAAPAPKQP